MATVRALKSRQAALKRELADKEYAIRCAIWRLSTLEEERIKIEEGLVSIKGRIKYQERKLRCKRAI